MFDPNCLSCQSLQAPCDEHKGEFRRYVDERSDLDQDNPVDVSAEVWSDIYADNPELLDDDHSMDY